MNTTLLFVEIFIAGLQALFWMCLLVFNLFGVISVPTETLEKLGDWTILLSALLFSFSYSLGILVDRVANTLFSFWDRRIQAHYVLGSTFSLSAIRFQLENEFLNKQLEYIRSRLRIARSSSLNFLLITVMLILFIYRSGLIAPDLRLAYSWFVGIVGGVCVALFVAAWYSLTKTNYNLVSEVNKALNNKSKPTRKK